MRCIVGKAVLRATWLLPVAATLVACPVAVALSVGFFAVHLFVSSLPLLLVFPRAAVQVPLHVLRIWGPVLPVLVLRFLLLLGLLVFLRSSLL